MNMTDQTAFEKFWKTAGSGDRELAVAAWKAGAEAASLTTAARLTPPQLARLLRAIDDVLEDWYCNDPDFHREFSCIENDLLQALDEARDVFRVAIGQGDLLQ